MRCKLCTKTQQKTRGKTWELWSICKNCFTEIKKSDIIPVRNKLISVNCLFCLKTIPATPQGGKAFCNSYHRSGYYHRKKSKELGINQWNLMALNGQNTVEVDDS